MTKSRKSKILALAFCASLMAGIYANPVMAANGDEDFNYQHNTTESGLNNPEIDHTVDNGSYWDDKGTWNPFDDEWVDEKWEPVHPEGDVNCEEEVANSNITVGDMNKVTADLVANDEMVNNKVNEVASDVKELTDKVNSIETTADTDTHIEKGEYKADADGNVTMDIVDKEGNSTGESVVITDVASAEKLEETTSTANNALTVAGTAQETAEDAIRVNNEQKEQLEKHEGQIADLEANDDNQDQMLQDHKNQLEKHEGQIADLEANDDNQDQMLQDHKNQLERSDCRFRSK